MEVGVDMPEANMRAYMRANLHSVHTIPTSSLCLLLVWVFLVPLRAGVVAGVQSCTTYEIKICNAPLPFLRA